MVIFYPVVRHVVIWGLLPTPDCLLMNISILCMVAKAHMRASQILRCFLSRDPLILIRAFNVYDRPIVEYCSLVWSPTAVRQINKIESVQRWFTKQIKSLSIWNRLPSEIVNFDTLSSFNRTAKLVDLSEFLKCF